MANFNSMPAMSSGATPGPDALGLTTSDMDAFNACISFDESLLDPVHGMPNIPFTPTPYDLETFSTTFEDPFSYPARPSFDAVPGGTRAGGIGSLTGGRGGAYHADDDDGSPPQEPDNKLLGFSAPIPSGKATLVSAADDQPVEPSMTGELYGMFFVAEDVFGGPDAATGTSTGAAVAAPPPPRPLELTCYRRNLWQISGQITLPRTVSHYLDEHGRRAPVAELAASITAIESIEGRVAEMITIPWRGATTNAPLGAEEARAVAPPPVVPLDLASGQEVDGGSRVSVPVSWKRLQFKHATANNGRRKGLQQHYIVQINLLVKTKGGEYVKVAEIQSGPVIVRGRSPRNFDSRREVPLGDKRPLERRSTEGSAGSSGAKQQQQQQQQQHSVHDGDVVGHGLRYGSLNNVQARVPFIPFPPSDAGKVAGGYLTKQQQYPSDWATPFTTHSTPNPQHPSKKLALSSPSLHRPPVPSWGSLDANKSSSSHSVPTKPPHRTNSVTVSTPQPLPITLSLSEDERSPNHRSSPINDGGGGSGGVLQSPSFAKSAAATLRSAAGGGGAIASGTHGAAAAENNNLSSNSSSSNNHHHPLASPTETEEDMLYEYFPLSLDDWLPPVDAVYRPHVVHHTIVSPEVKAQQMRSKAKRYFAAE